MWAVRPHSAAGVSAKDAQVDQTTHGVTFGVEEEFLLVDPDSWQVTSQAREVIALIPQRLRDHVHHELHLTQVELATPVCSSLTELRDWLAVLRGHLVSAADEVGCRLIAAGSGVLDAGAVPPLTEGERYRRMADEFGALTAVQGVCATHVHVGIGSREVATAVSNWLRPYLPTLQAICANSPFVDGRDTGYASWRSVQWSRWPSAGPAPWWRSAAHYDETVAVLVRSGALLDARMAYWYTRLSPRYPTIEVRAGDVCPTIDEATLLAALTRALVVVAIARSAEGHDAVAVDDHLLRAARWRAARDGLEGVGLTLPDGDPQPAWRLLDSLVAEVRPVLEANGDWPTVQRLVGQLRAHGTGAARQRAASAAGTGLPDVVAFLADETRRGVQLPVPA